MEKNRALLAMVGCLYRSPYYKNSHRNCRSEGTANLIPVFTDKETGPEKGYGWQNRDLNQVWLLGWVLSVHTTTQFWNATGHGDCGVSKSSLPSSQPGPDLGVSLLVPQQPIRFQQTPASLWHTLHPTSIWLAWEAALEQIRARRTGLR